MNEIPNKDERTWAMIVHLSAFAFFIFPFGNVLGPLIVWLIKKDEFKFVEEQGKEVINFQISIIIYALISAILVIFLIGFVLLFALFIVDFILTVIAAIKANEGIAYKYPLTIRIIN